MMVKAMYEGNVLEVLELEEYDQWAIYDWVYGLLDVYPDIYENIQWILADPKKNLEVIWR